jgi:hypothetical protein
LQVPTPVLKSLFPVSSNNQVDANVTLTGSDFDPAVIATITLADGTTQTQQNPQGIPTESEFWITIPASDLPSPGTLLIAAENGDGQLSGALPYTVLKGPPFLTSLAPTSSSAGAATAITLSGSNFDSGVIGYVTLADGATTRDYAPSGTPSATQFVIDVPAADTSVSYSVFGTYVMPTVSAIDNTQEWGAWFYCTASANILALMYWKQTGQTGTQIGNLWDANGNLLATVTFTNQTASGWQTQYLSTPIALTPNAYYCASYSGDVSYANNWFSQDYSSGPLTFPSDAHADAAGQSGNGAYNNNAKGQFPNKSSQQLWPYIDVLVSAATPGTLKIVAQNGDKQQSGPLSYTLT